MMTVLSWTEMPEPVKVVALSLRMIFLSMVSSTLSEVGVSIEERSVAGTLVSGIEDA